MAYVTEGRPKSICTEGRSYHPFCVAAQAFIGRLRLQGLTPGCAFPATQYPPPAHLRYSARLSRVKSLLFVILRRSSLETGKDT